MSVVVFNRAKKEILDGTIDLLNDVIKVMLVTSAYTPDPDHDFVDEAGADAEAAELSGTGYAAGFAGSGRKTLSNKTVTESDGTNKAYFDNTVDLTWSAINAGTAAGFIVYKHLTSSAASVMICFVDTGGFPIVTNGGDLTVQFNAAGILELA